MGNIVEGMCFDTGQIKSSVFGMPNLKIIFIFQIEMLKRQLDDVWSLIQTSRLKTEI